MMKKEQAYILFAALFIGGYVAGRVTAPKTGGVAPIAVAAAPGTPGADAAQAAAPGAPVAAAGATTSEPPPPPPPPPPPAPTAAAGAPAGEGQVWRGTLHDTDPKLGPDTATVKVLVLSAFGCAQCTEFAGYMKKSREKYGDKVQWRFKHKIIPPQHPDSALASEASMAANAQGKFWEYHDKLMANSFSIDRLSLERYAQELGLNMAKFKKALDDHTYRGILARDSVLANEIGAHSFPNILANGIRIGKEKTQEQLDQLIDGQLERAQKLLAEGATIANLYEKAIEGGKFFPQYETPQQSFNTTNSPTIGPKTAKVELVVFEDFECPFCSKLAPSLKLFQKNNPNEVKIVYKHMPLESIHQNAMLASEASLAAHEQGKFWEYHDKLYENQQSLDRASLDRYAEELKLDMAKFKAALDTHKFKGAIQADMNEGQNAGISGTPTVYLNGYKYAGPRGYPPEGLEGVARMYLGL